MWRCTRGIVVGLLVTYFGDELGYAERYVIGVYDGDVLKGTVEADDHPTAFGLLTNMTSQAQDTSVDDFLSQWKLPDSG